MNQNSTAATYANYTFIDGVRQHEYELHATGCRDLKNRPNPRWTVDADSHEAALAEFMNDCEGKAVVFVQACCNPRRMAAAGRILTRTLPVEVSTIEVVEVTAETGEATDVVTTELDALPTEVVEVEPEPVAKSKSRLKKERKAAKKTEVAA